MDNNQNSNRINKIKPEFEKIEQLAQLFMTWFD